MLLESILVSEDAERVLLFLASRGKGYSKEVADYYERSINGIQKQLGKYEVGGVLMSSKVGRTRIYEFNPGYPLLKELKMLMEKAIQFLPREEAKRLTVFSQARAKRKGTVKPVSEMSRLEFASFVAAKLHECCISIVLSGGSCVSICSSDQYHVHGS
jgi:hypothetical protein